MATLTPSIIVKNTSAPVHFFSHPFNHVMRESQDFIKQLKRTREERNQIAIKLSSLAKKTFNAEREYEVMQQTALLQGCRVSCDQLKRQLQCVKQTKEIGKLWRHVVNLDQEVSLTEKKAERLMLLYRAELPRKARILLDRISENCKNLLKLQDRVQTKLEIEKLLVSVKHDIDAQNEVLANVVDQYVVVYVRKLHVLTLECLLSVVDELLSQQNLESDTLQKEIFQLLNKNWPHELYPLNQHKQVKEIELGEEGEAFYKQAELELVGSELSFSQGSWIWNWIPSWSSKTTYTLTEQFEKIVKQIQLFNQIVEKHLEEVSSDAPEIKPTSTSKGGREYLKKKEIFYKNLSHVLHEKIKSMRILLFKESGSKVIRERIYFADFLERVREEIDEKLTTLFAKVDQGIKKAEKRLCVYLPIVSDDSNQNVDALIQEVRELFKTVAETTVLFPTLKNDKDADTLCTIVDGVGSRTLEHARKISEGVWLTILGGKAQELSAQQIELYLITEMLYSLYAKNYPNDLKIKLALLNLDAPNFKDKSKEIYEAYAAVKRPICADFIVDVLHPIYKKLVLCERENCPFMKVRYYAESAHLIQMQRAKAGEFMNAALDQAQNDLLRLKEENDFPELASPEQYLRDKEFILKSLPVLPDTLKDSEKLTDQLFFTFLTYTLFAPEDLQVGLSLVMDAFPTPIHVTIKQLQAFYAFKLMVAGGKLNVIEEKAYKDILKQYVSSPSTSKSLSYLYGTAVCEALLYQSVKGVDGKEFVLLIQEARGKDEYAKWETALSHFLNFKGVQQKLRQSSVDRRENLRARDIAKSDFEYALKQVSEHSPYHGFLKACWDDILSII